MGDTYPKAGSYQNSMCPSNHAVSHPAYPLLAEWSQLGCPEISRKQWTRTGAQITMANKRGQHQSATSPKALAHFATKTKEKVALAPACIVLWDDIKGNLPPKLKILPKAAIPHKSNAFRSILDLSFNLCLKDGSIARFVNNTLEKSASQGVVDQIRHALQHSRIR